MTERWQCGICNEEYVGDPCDECNQAPYPCEPDCCCFTSYNGFPLWYVQAKFKEFLREYWREDTEKLRERIREAFWKEHGER